MLLKDQNYRFNAETRGENYRSLVAYRAACLCDKEASLIGTPGPINAINKQQRRALRLGVSEVMRCVTDFSLKKNDLSSYEICAALKGFTS